MLAALCVPCRENKFEEATMSRRTICAQICAARMDQEEFDEFDEDAPPPQRLRIVPRMKLRQLAYSLRTGGLCCGEIQLIEGMEDQVLELGFALCECFHADVFDEEEQRNFLLLWFVQYLETVRLRMPTVILCDLPSGRHLIIDRLCDSWCWNSFRFRKSGLREIFDGSG